MALGASALVAACASPGPEPARTPEGGQTFAQALQLMCDVDARAGIDANTDVLEVEQLRQEAIARDVKNPDGIELRTLLTPQQPADKAKRLRAHAAEAGITRCALADAWEREAQSG